MLKRYRYGILLFYVSAAAALVCAYFYDLPLDIRLNNPANVFAIWLKNTGEIPAYLVCPAAGILLMLLCKKTWQKVCGALVNLGGSVYLGIYLGDAFFLEENRTLFGALWGVGFALLFFFFSRFITVPKKYKQTLIILSVLGICVLAAELLLTSGMKMLWGRVRYRDLLAAGSTEAFTSFLTVNGFNGNKSFPSGHTASAAVSYLAMFLPQLSRKCREHAWLCFAAPFVYTSLVAYTRLVMGAHYLSDVTVGGAVCFTCVIVSMKLYETVCKKRGLPLQA